MKAAHEAAARALETEVARVRAEAEAGLKGDLERFRKEAAEARLAQAQSQLESETLRELAAQEARMAAQAAAARELEAEVARVRADADAKLVTPNRDGRLTNLAPERSRAKWLASRPTQTPT